MGATPPYRLRKYPCAIASNSPYATLPVDLHTFINLIQIYQHL